MYVCTLDGVHMIGVRETLVSAANLVAGAIQLGWTNPSLLDVGETRWSIGAWDTQAGVIVECTSSGMPELDTLMNIEKAIDAYMLAGKLTGPNNL